MKYMYNIIVVSVLYLLFSSGVSAQQREYKGKMQITPLGLEQKGDSLYVNIGFDIRGVNVESRRSISLIPVLAAPGRELKLPEVMVKGRANYLTSKRELALMGRAERRLYEQNPPYAVVKGYKDGEQKQILYSKTIPYEPWMKDARLDIREDLCGCGNAPRSLEVSQLVNRVQLEQKIVIEPYVVTPHLAYVQPVAEAVKKREMVGEAFLDFVVSKTDIRPDYMNNPRELKKITDMVTEARNDPAVTVNGISVAGYASPEGTLKFNRYLSEGRANALVGYLLPRFDYPKEMYRVEFGGENWKGLRDVVDSSQMKYKEQVLAILTDEAIGDELRKTRLKQLQGGEPYRFMVKEYYPSLRKAICKIDYQVKGFEAAEAREVFKTRPQNLSLNEMYLVANTYPTGSGEFVDVFETAVRMFPRDETANLNAASAALARKDTVSAERYLERVVSRVRIPEYDNAMGVLMMLKGDYEKAEGYFKSADRAGLESARRNLNELEKKLENIKLINEQ